MINIRGIQAATVTPMGSDGSIDEKQIRSQISFLKSQKQVVGYLVNGHAGEIPYVSLEEQLTNLRIYREMDHDATITCGVCTDDPQTAIRNIAELARNGAHAALVFPPYSLSGPSGQAALLHYYQTVCNKTSLPILLYSASYFSNQIIQVPDLIKLASLPNVIAIKDGSWEVVRFEWIKEEVEKAKLKVEVLGSSDEHFFYNYISGSSGCQASMVTILPELISELIGYVHVGNIQAAKDIHKKLAPIARFIYRTPTSTDMVARLKLGLSLRGVIDAPIFRAPREPITKEEMTTMSRMMTELTN